MTAMVVFPAAVPSAVLWLGFGLCLFAVALVCRDRRAVMGLLVAAVCAGALVARDTPPPPKPDSPIYCPCTFTACLFGVCVPNHRMTAPDARQPWILR